MKMTTQEQTFISIVFAEGTDVTPVIVFEGVELESKTFNITTHEIEELIEFVHYNENGGCDVYL